MLDLWAWATASIAADGERSVNMKAYLLTGEPRVGKTTALKKIIAALGFERCGGFYTAEVCALGERCGFRLITLDGTGRYSAGWAAQSWQIWGLSPVSRGHRSYCRLSSVGVQELRYYRRDRPDATVFLPLSARRHGCTNQFGPTDRNYLFGF